MRADGVNVEKNVCLMCFFEALLAGLNLLLLIVPSAL